MRIAIFHGYELTGSGSNEYTRYLAAALARQGHEVHVVCREPHPEAVAEATAAVAWDADGTPTVVFGEPGGLGRITIQQLPQATVRPVYVADKQRKGNVKTFVELSDAELAEVRALAGRVLTAVLSAYPVDILHANHMVLQPTIAADACGPLGIPFIIYPHGSAIEYTLRRDPRYWELAGDALLASAGLITGSQEMHERLLALYPEHRGWLMSHWSVVGVGVDTSLFSPVPRSGRAASVAELIASVPGGGRPPEISRELADRLDDGDLDAIGDYRNAYPREFPDSDAADKLARIPWNDGHILLSVGALTVGKGVQSLIAALPAVLRDVPDTHLVIVGSGSYREALEALVHAIAAGDAGLLDALVARGMEFDATHLTGAWPDVTDYLTNPTAREIVLSAGPDFAEHVHFLGRLDHSRLNRLFPCADLAVFPSVVPEAYPLVLMESLSCGVLPAASDEAGMGEGLALLEPHLGIGVVERLKLPTGASGRVQGIAERLTALLSDPDLGDLGPDLREIAVTEYDWQIRARAMVAAYERFGGMAP